MSAFTVFAYLFKIEFVETRLQKTKLPALIFAGSFLCLLAITMTKNPTQSVGIVMVVFLLLMVIIFCLGYILLILRAGSVGRRGLQKLAIFSIGLIFALMLKSADSLNVIDAIVLFMITIGLLFYSGRRGD
jgi:hypothetical protein